MSYVQFNQEVIGYKKVMDRIGDSYILTLLIPKGKLIHAGMLGEAINKGFSDRDRTGCVLERGADLTGKHNTRQSSAGRLTVDGVFFLEYKCRSECAEVLEIESVTQPGVLVDSITRSPVRITTPDSPLIVIEEIEYTVGDIVYPHAFYTGDYESDTIAGIQISPACESGIHWFPERWMAEAVSVTFLL